MAEANALPFGQAAPGNADFERIMDVVAAMLSGAAANQATDGLDPPHHTALTISAAGVLAGYLFGATIIAGMASDKDTRRAGLMLLTNFRQGVKIGKDNAMRSIEPAGRS